jgi:hypothetical protein
MLATITKTTLAFLLLGASLIGCIMMFIRTGEIEDDEFDEDEHYQRRQDKNWPS